MNFDFSDDQNVLRNEVRKFLMKESPLSAAREVLEQNSLWHGKVWEGLTGMGVTTLMLPESCGGIGLGALELCVVAEEAGRQLAAVPLSSSLYLGLQAWLLGASPAQQQHWLPRLAQGEIATLAAPLDGNSGGNLPRFSDGSLHGVATLVPDGGCAALAVVLAQTSDGKPVLVAADLANAVERKPLATLDLSRPFADLQFNGTPAQQLDSCDDALALLQRVRDRAAVLLAFEQLGGADAALDMACNYARERKSFGRAIGSYQGIKHKLADMYTANQMARAHCYYGAWALLSDAPELPAAAAAARIAASEAFSFAAQENLQTHGGMGYTWELDCHLFYRRARQLAVMLGGVQIWRERLATALEQQLDAACAATT